MSVNTVKYYIAGIRFLLDRALDNLINNAIRHSPEHKR